MDPPDHTELRNLMNTNFKPRAALETEPHMRKIVCEALDRLESQSECDFVDAVSAPISLRVLTNFLGVPDPHTARFYRWTNQIMRFGEPGFANLLRARFALLQIFVQSALLARVRKKEPTTDPFSNLVNGEFGGKPLTRMMVQINFFLLIVAGNETTRNALSGGGSRPSVCTPRCSASPEDRTPTSPSAPAPTSAWGATSRGSRCVSPSKSSCGGSRPCTSLGHRRGCNPISSAPSNACP